jgi:hypothetical protein
MNKLSLLFIKKIKNIYNENKINKDKHHLEQHTHTYILNITCILINIYMYLYILAQKSIK